MFAINFLMGQVLRDVAGFLQGGLRFDGQSIQLHGFVIKPFWKPSSWPHENWPKVPASSGLNSALNPAN